VVTRGDTTGTEQLLERGRELAAVDAGLQAASIGSGTFLVVRGPAGIGKSRLLAAASARAGLAGFDVLSARGGVMEGEYSFGIVRQLLEPVTSDARRALMLSGAGAAAAPVMSREGLAVSAPDAMFAVLNGLYWAVANLSSERPLLIVVDDAQWSDEPSLRFLDFLARRLDDLPVMVIAAWRSGEPGSTQAAQVLGELEASGLTQVVEPRTLSEAGVHELTREVFGAEPDPEFAAACRARTGGNPFFLAELLRALREEDVPPTSAGVDRVADVAPQAVGRVVLARLARLGPDAASLAKAVASLGGTAHMVDAAELARLTDRRAADAAAALTQSGILAGRPQLEFVHPLMRDAIESDTTPALRADAHFRAARLLAANGRPVDHVVAHILASPERADPWAVTWLRQAGREARERGAPETAAQLLSRALREPPPSDLRPTVLAELGRAEASLDRPEAVEHLRAAATALPTGRERAGTALVLARRLWLAGRLSEVYDAVAEGQDGLGGDERELSLYLEAIGLSACAHDPRPGVPFRSRFAALYDLPGDTPGERAVLAAVAFEWVKTCRPIGEVLALVERALAGHDALSVDPSETLARLLLIGVLHWSSQISRSIQLASAQIDHARTIGSAMLFAEMSAARALANWRGGMLGPAEADARQALAAVGSHSGQMYGIATHALIGALSDRGDVGAAEALAVDFLPPGQRSSNAMWPVVACSYGQLEAALGRPEQALRRLTIAGAAIEATGCRHPAAGEWRQPAARLLAATGRRAEALEMLGPALQAAHESGGAYELGISLRTAALIEDPVDLDALREAVAVLEPSELRLHHARALVDLGAALRRAGHRRDAREPLSEGMEIAADCGAAPLLSAARTELLAAGARPRRVARTGADALTPSELRVAQLAADGLANREIAQHLFVSPRTVEAQLRSSYAKLGIKARSELGAALAGSELK
jgi:DNA-binding CsgD family transcriptional regulator